MIRGGTFLLFRIRGPASRLRQTGLYIVFFCRRVAVCGAEIAEIRHFRSSGRAEKSLLRIISQIVRTGRPRRYGGAAAAPERRLPADVMKCHDSSCSCLSTILAVPDLIRDPELAQSLSMGATRTVSACGPWTPPSPPPTFRGRAVRIFVLIMFRLRMSSPFPRGPAASAVPVETGAHAGFRDPFARRRIDTTECDVALL